MASLTTSAVSTAKTPGGSVLMKTPTVENAVRTWEMHVFSLMQICWFMKFLTSSRITLDSMPKRLLP
eukprot:scaffold17160_cov158-Skeletonema_marinoi.AAC.2